MRRTRSTLLLAASLLFATRADAQTSFTFTSGGTVTAYGYYVGNYSGLMGTTPVTLNCVDFFHEVYIGETWKANLTNLGTATTGVTTRFADLTLYREAAWLTTQYAGKSAVDVGLIQATVWNLFGNTGLAGSSYWLSQAQANYASMNFSDVYIVTDVLKGNSNSVQEFVMVSTPEPATFVLFGTGLTSIVGVGLKRRKRAIDAT
jgi:PEP-CTERM motif